MWQRFRSWPSWTQVLAWLLASPIVWSIWVFQKRLWPMWIRVGLFLAAWGVVALFAVAGSAGSKPSAAESQPKAAAESTTSTQPAPETTTARQAATTTHAATTTEAVTTTQSKPAAPTTTSSGDPEVDKNTRYYMNQMSTCMISVGLVLLDIQKQKDDITLADDTTSARDICDEIRTNLAVADTDHFDDQAALGFYAVDRFKSGLNALLKFIDTQEPSKLIEVRNKLQDADESAGEAFKEINQRRHVYGLRSYNP